jgi:hypothetical protein
MRDLWNDPVVCGYLCAAAGECRLPEFAPATLAHLLAEIGAWKGECWVELLDYILAGEFTAERLEWIGRQVWAARNLQPSFGDDNSRRVIKMRHYAKALGPIKLHLNQSSQFETTT